MSRSWCLVIALLMSGSTAAAAAVSNTDAVTPTSRYAKVASHADGFFRMAQKTCEPRTWSRTEDVNCPKGGVQKGVCVYTRDKYCNTRKSCKPYRPC
jgi:hypothetical protein